MYIYIICTYIYIYIYKWIYISMYIYNIIYGYIICPKSSMHGDFINVHPSSAVESSWADIQWKSCHPVPEEVHATPFSIGVLMLHVAL